MFVGSRDVGLYVCRRLFVGISLYVRLSGM